MDGAYRPPRRGTHNDHAHPPIHPTMCVDNLDNHEKRVYEFIARRFLACCSSDAVGNETIVSLKYGDEMFTTSGLVIQSRNYLEVYHYDKWTSVNIPDFVQGDAHDVALRKKQGSTTAPRLLSEADLITCMEKNGIGTDATIHEHIKKIQDREYAKKTGTVFVPTSLGLALVQGYEAYNFDLSLTKPQLRAQVIAPN